VARLQAGANRSTFVVNSARPINFVDKRSGREKFPVGSVENVKKAVAIRFYNEFSQLTAKGCVHQNRSFHSVVIEQVVRRKLEIPFELTGVRIESQ